MLLKTATPKPRLKRRPTATRRNLAIATWEGFPAVIFQTLLGGQFLTGFLLYLGATSGEIGFVLAVTTFVNIAQIAVAYLVQKLKSRRRPLLITIILHRVLWGATGLVPFIFPKEDWVFSFIVLYTAAFLFSTISGMLWNSLIGDLVPMRVRGRYFGIRNTVLNAVGTVILFLGGVVLDHFPQSQGFLILYIVVWVCITANMILFFFTRTCRLNDRRRPVSGPCCASRFMTVNLCIPLPFWPVSYFCRI